MTVRWIHSNYAPQSAQLLRALPELRVSGARAARLERELMIQLQCGHAPWILGPSSKLALALCAAGGLAVAATVGSDGLGPSSTTASMAPAAQHLEPSHHLIDAISGVEATPPLVAVDPSAERAGKTTVTRHTGRQNVRTATPAVPSSDEYLVIEAVRALKREGDPDKARELAGRYLAENPDGHLAEEATEVLLQAARVTNLSQ